MKTLFALVVVAVCGYYMARDTVNSLTGSVNKVSTTLKGK